MKVKIFNLENRKITLVSYVDSYLNHKEKRVYIVYIGMAVYFPEPNYHYNRDRGIQIAQDRAKFVTTTPVKNITSAYTIYDSREPYVYSANLGIVKSREVVNDMEEDILTHVKRMVKKYSYVYIPSIKTVTRTSKVSQNGQLLEEEVETGLEFSYPI